MLGVGNIKTNKENQVWRDVPVVPALNRQEQEPVSAARQKSCLKETEKKKRGQGEGVGSRDLAFTELT